MEENKNTIDLTPEQGRKKMSYEELENVAHQMSEQSRHLYNQLQQMEMTNMFKRLDYLFKVIENRSAFSNVFVDACVSEIEDVMTINPQDNEDNNQE